MPWPLLFSISNMIALVGWVILIFGPRRYAWLHIIPHYVIPLILSLSYALIIMIYFFQAEGGFDSIENVRALFQHDAVLLGGWQHYLAFDLFIGAWCAVRMDRFSVSRWLQAPILAACFMFGPLGFLLAMLTTQAHTVFTSVKG